MTKIWVGPTGSIIKGNVLDCARSPLEEALRDYDPQLYVAWNPKNLRGAGCWELRRRPEYKRPVDSATYQGNTYVRLEYKENNFENHVKNFEFLNYSILKWVQDHDLWKDHYRGEGVMDAAEYNEAKYDEKIEDRAMEELKYGLKQHRSELKWFAEYVNSGGNPYRIADYWGKSKN